MIKFSSMVVLVALVASPALAGTVIGSKHDMIASGFASVSGAPAEVCVFCHTPHNATPELVPLWNNTANPIAADFYSSPTTSFATSAALINATDARICFACHDGSVSGPNTNGGTITIEATAMSPNAILGAMTNDHPIGMDIGGTPETTDLQGSMRSLAAIRANFGGDDPFYGGAPMDSTNIMYCSSCHDVHDGDPLKKPFLRKSNVGSALCKACHKR